MNTSGIVESMKDFYWDVRPKPEFGTIEIRVCDTPLTVERAPRSPPMRRRSAAGSSSSVPTRSPRTTTSPTRTTAFQACRFRPGRRDRRSRRPACAARSPRTLRLTLQAVAMHARELECEEPLQLLGHIAREGNDARWMREAFADAGSLSDLVWQQGERFRAGG
jgi:carboxylate-amine ligase